MTAKEFAEMLFGRENGMEISGEESRSAAESGLIALYGYSDDNVEIVGAFRDEVGAYNGTTIFLTKTGVLQDPACDCVENCNCPYFTRAKNNAKTVNAVWHNDGGPCWTFETDIPHETFTILEDGEPWCIGIVFSMEDLEVTA